VKSEGNALKNRGPTVGFTFTTMLQHTEWVLVKESLAKNNATTLEHLLT